MKRKIFIALALLSMTTSLVSCYTYETVTKYRYESAQDDYNRRYRGYTRSQIINELGAPDRVVPVDSSSVILIYEKYTSSISRPIDPLGLELEAILKQGTEYLRNTILTAVLNAIM